MPATRKFWLFSAFVLITPVTAFAECAEDIIGKWQQTYVEFGGNRINDDSQSWEFMENGKVRFLKPIVGIDVSGDYSCEGDIIYMKASPPSRLKIVEYSGDTMALESLDHGGGISHVRKVP
jgi:hypothetical protein